MKKAVILLISHGLVLVLGFVAGIYTLPILIAPDSPTAAEVASVSQSAGFRGQFQRDLAGSDRLHWGEGEVAISDSRISLNGELAPGPDYKLYLSPVFVEDEAEFMAAKADMVRIADIKTFTNFIVDIPAGVDPGNYTTVIVWCETFGEFITAAQYR